MDGDNKKEFLLKLWNSTIRSLISSLYLYIYMDIRVSYISTVLEVLNPNTAV